MSENSPVMEGSCGGSGLLVTPYVIEDQINVICSECKAEVPLRLSEEADEPVYVIALHQPGRPSAARRVPATQLMLGL